MSIDDTLNLKYGNVYWLKFKDLQISKFSIHAYSTYIGFNGRNHVFIEENDGEFHVYTAPEGSRLEYDIDNDDNPFVSPIEVSDYGMIPEKERETAILTLNNISRRNSINIEKRLNTLGIFLEQ